MHRALLCRGESAGYLFADHPFEGVAVDFFLYYLDCALSFQRFYRLRAELGTERGIVESGNGRIIVEIFQKGELFFCGFGDWYGDIPYLYYFFIAFTHFAATHFRRKKEP